jgi:hypothetical protein
MEGFRDESPNGNDVYFDPEGADHRLMPDDEFRVECYPPDGETIEIAHHPDGMSLYIGAAWTIRAFRRDGGELNSGRASGELHSAWPVSGMAADRDCFELR